MSSPTPTISISRDELVFCVKGTGLITHKDVISIIEKHYPSLDRCDLLWDFSGGDISGVGEEDFRTIAAAAARCLPVARHRKTAYVVADVATYARIWKYINTAFVAGVPSEYGGFMDLNRAKQWLAR